MLALAVAALAPTAAPAAEPPPSYAGFTVSTFLGFLDPPAPGGVITTIPHLRMSFGGLPREAVMDTGSTGIVVSADAIPHMASLPSLGPASLTYSSSGRIMQGERVVTPVTIAGADGTSVATAPIPVIAVTRIACLPNARDCTPDDRPKHVSMIGIGFGREYDHQERQTPDTNPFLNLATSDGLRRGYVITTEGVIVGLTAQAAAGVGFVKLARDETYADWSGAPACITVAATPPACGKLLVDTGVRGMYLTVPPDRLIDGKLPPGTALSVSFGAAGAFSLGYGFTVGDTEDPVAPGFVTLSGIGVRPPFVNTSFHLLNGFDYLFDADGGWVGFRKR